MINFSVCSLNIVLISLPIAVIFEYTLAYLNTQRNNTNGSARVHIDAFTREEKKEEKVRRFP
jgi:hypothetical protein